ncbi:hypothetical protein PPERSA_05712 [Pseudocohnilembus persalinus]|uniref:EF-hand domain-containing protein n=1 Tax=Pseudocohnilembus persalinus TaxID=266149 RepID=A0A0V0QMF7_PSEPJ|nr:hypothetical protein PPERSA_05712 [Pseudocohnilembus persalinus]|eukprot:KRX03354.1 hypothetical protein PPERSA_05712 [Pseudocohnilembus persalinus]
MAQFYQQKNQTQLNQQEQSEKNTYFTNKQYERDIVDDKIHRIQLEIQREKDKQLQFVKSQKNKKYSDDFIGNKDLYIESPKQFKSNPYTPNISQIQFKKSTFEINKNPYYDSNEKNKNIIPVTSKENNLQKDDLYNRNSLKSQEFYQNNDQEYLKPPSPFKSYDQNNKFSFSQKSAFPDLKQKNTIHNFEEKAEQLQQYQKLYIDLNSKQQEQDQEDIYSYLEGLNNYDLFDVLKLFLRHLCELMKIQKNIFKNKEKLSQIHNFCIQSFFNYFDIKNKNEITLPEFIQGLRSLDIHIDQQDLQNILQELSSFQSANKALNKDQITNYINLFSSIDIEHKGYIVARDLQIFLNQYNGKFTLESVEELFQAFTHKNSVRVNLEEFLQLYKQTGLKKFDDIQFVNLNGENRQIKQKEKSLNRSSVQVYNSNQNELNFPGFVKYNLQKRR